MPDESVSRVEHRRRTRAALLASALTAALSTAARRQAGHRSRVRVGARIRAAFDALDGRVPGGA